MVTHRHEAQTESWKKYRIKNIEPPEVSIAEAQTESWKDKSYWFLNCLNLSSEAQTESWKSVYSLYRTSVFILYEAQTESWKLTLLPLNNWRYTNSEAQTESWKVCRESCILCMDYWMKLKQRVESGSHAPLLRNSMKNEAQTESWKYTGILIDKWSGRYSSIEAQTESWKLMFI